MIFENRGDAGYAACSKLKRLKLAPKNTVVVGIARGGVAVAKVISSVLKIPLLVIVIKKIGAPYNPELAIGAVGSLGKPVMDRELIKEIDIAPDYIKNEIIKMRAEAKTREKFLGVKITRKDISGKDVVVVDDGLATGQSAKAAALILKSLGARKLILAVPVAAYATIDFISRYFDKIICPAKVSDFMAVGQFYKDFRPVSDQEVKQLLSN